MMHVPTSQPSDHAAHTRHISPLTWGILGGLGALTLAPYALPAIGIGPTDSASGIMHLVGASPTGDPLGTGWAASAQRSIAAIPGIGGALTSTEPVQFLGMSMASGAVTTLLATAGLGIGGVLLANWIEKHEDPNQQGIRWSKVVRFAALATSALIALPGILGAISVGITFFATLLGPAGSGSYTGLAMQNFTGATNMHAASAAAGGIAAMLPHLFTCGLAALPVVGALFMSNNKPRENGLPPTIMQGPLQRDGRLQAAPAAGLGHAH